MKGLVVPSNKTSHWWNTKLETLVDENINGNVFFENLFFDEGEQVHLHMLIPTQFGIMLNKKRNEMVYKAVKKFMVKNKHLNDITVKSLMLFQESFMISCVICRGVCYIDTSKPYQMCLRVIGGYKTPNSGVWHFDYVFQVFCRSCQSQPWHALLVFDPNYSYNAFVNALQFLNVHKQFRPEDVIGPAFLKRFIFINQVIPTFTKLLHQDVVITCHHCGKHENTIEPCKGCKSIYFCVDGTSKDKRLVDTELEHKTCAEVSDIYHKQYLCLELQKERLFHVTCALYVLPSGKVEIAPLGEEEEELINNDD